ncbi:CBS domain-containing protein [Streptomyces tagetis]|uniref:CBS domain-containing protein n=1 Tax=Streptomyces tagetis TaxID=2820809 RepID=A0A941AXB0_9ACTN|nr:CBS domain-containing protein [Streptomyces sp. RG38]MBQ0825954.1 CBS domain-containing protein [Streptomyces sp. RG38]
MTRTVVALAGGAVFKDIVRAIETRGISALPVLGPGNEVIGIVSEADLLRTEEGRDRHARPQDTLARRPGPAVTARELMTSPAVTVHPDATLAEAARLMARHRVKRLPVVGSDGALAGLVSRSDLLRVFLRPDEEIAEEVRREVVAERLPGSADGIRVGVHEGVVTLSGQVPDPTVVPLVVRLVRSVEGVVDVRYALTGPEGVAVP